MADTTGMADLRAEHVERIVTGFALQEYKFKQLCTIRPSNSWKETYYVETSTELTGGTGANIKGVPRLAAFPYGEPSWTETSGRLLKFAMTGQVSWEDAKTDAIDVVARTLLRIARAVAKSVDDYIWDTISESQSATNINSHSITAGNEWDSSTVQNRDPIQDILTSARKIQEYYYDTYTNGFLCVNPKDFANLMGNPNIRNAGQFYTPDATKNGRVGRLCGLTVIVSPSVTADYALVCVGKECATWYSAHDLSTHTEEDAGVKYTIKAWEVGMCALNNPRAVTLIDNTAA